MAKKKRLRCFLCNKKLTETTFIKCAYDKIFCLPHRYHYIHNCESSPSLKKQWKDKLTKENPIIKTDT